MSWERDYIGDAAVGLKEYVEKVANSKNKGMYAKYFSITQPPAWASPGWSAS